MLYSKDKLDHLQHRWTTPRGKKMLALIKKTRCYLSPVLFREKVRGFPGINDPEVKDQVDLRGAPLAGFDFRTQIPDDYDQNFIEDVAILSEIHFEGANLKYSNFQDGKIHNCYFEHSNLSHANFQNCYLNDVNFHEAECYSTNFSSAKLINCSFIDTSIRDFIIDTTIVDPKTNFGKRLKSEKDGHLHFASIEYKKIKQMYKNSNLHHISDDFHYKEMVTKRKTSHKLGIMRGLKYIFGDLLCRYGTSFIRIFVSSLIIIIICAGIFTNENALMHRGEIVENPNFASALYFSIVSFTTLGYGDYFATGWYRFVAAAESFVGAALMALFTVIVARILIRD